MFKGEKGITLVALVVTIVVLLILAGVSISLVVGQNGMITKAKETQKAQDKAYARDMVEDALKAVEIEVLSNTLPSGATANIAYVEGKIDDTDNKFSTSKENEIVYTPKNGTTYTVTINLNNYTVTDVK